MEKPAFGITTNLACVIVTLPNMAAKLAYSVIPTMTDPRERQLATTLAEAGMEPDYFKVTVTEGPEGPNFFKRESSEIF
jgi:hypothetical protein